MALQRDTRYPGRWTTGNSAHPQGAFKNRSAPGALDGSYIEQDWANDWDGFFAALLGAASITPNGIVDTATSSQYFTALQAAVPGRLLGAPRIFSTPGTFTYAPTAGTKFVIVEVQAPGGAGGGAVATGAGQSSLGAPGGGGSYAKSLLTSGFSGASVVVGLGGAGVSGAAGNNGGTSSFGAVISCPGGRGGAVTTAGSGAAFEIGTLNSSAPTGGNISSNVGSGSTRIISLTSITIVAGNAGSTIFGPGGQYLSSGSNGTASTSFGAGGGATGNIPSSSALTGGAGAPGVVIIWEYA